MRKRKWDREHGMSLEEVAARLGCTNQNVSYLERKALRNLRIGLSRLLTDDEWITLGLKGVPREQETER